MFSDNGEVEQLSERKEIEQFSSEAKVDLSVLNLASFKDFEARGAINCLVCSELASTVFQYRAHSGAYYASEINRSKWSIQFQEAVDSLRRVPDEEIYPLMDWELPVVTIIGQRNVQVRYPAVVSWACKTSGTTKVAGRFLAEAQALEMIRQRPHRNLLVYSGCLVGRGRLIGLVCPKYELDIYEWLDHQPRHQLEAVFAELSNGVKHLHALGLAHNSIEPEHIMMKKDGDVHHPVLTHMDRALPFGRKLHHMETNTCGWDAGFEDVSSPTNDELALDNIWKLLIGERACSG